VAFQQHARSARQTVVWRRWIRLVAVSLVAVALLSTAAVAESGNPLKPADTSSPRDTLRSFYDACNEAYSRAKERRQSGGYSPERKAILQRLMECLDLSELPPNVREDVGAEAAVCLKEVIDRIDQVGFEGIPGKEEVEEAEESGGMHRWRIPGTRIAFDRIAEGSRQGEYLFSKDTVAEAKEYYQLVEEFPYKRNETPQFYYWFVSHPGWMIPAGWIQGLPEWARSRHYGQAVWQWFGLFVAFAVGLLVMFIAYRFGRRFGRAGREESVLGYCLALAFPIVAMLVPLMVENFVTEQLRITGTALTIVRFSSHIVFLLAVIVVLMGAGNRVAEIIISSPRINPKGIDAQFIRLMSRVISLAAAVVVFLEGGQYLGIPLTTLLAGAGVGGLAFALAAQDTLKNLFGSMMIVLDKPYRVGERIVTKGYDGVVEEIGLRSTKMRLLTGHQATIPNEEMARIDIENVGRRPHIRRKTDIAIQLDTPAEKVDQAVKIVRGILDNHEGMEPEFPPRVFFTEFNRDSLNLRIMYWFHPPNYWEALAFGEQVNMQIMREFEGAGIHFALPTTKTLMKRVEEQPPGIEMGSGEPAT
jgi:MscS family membrane protein